MIYENLIKGGANDRKVSMMRWFASGTSKIKECENQTIIVL